MKASAGREIRKVTADYYKVLNIGRDATQGEIKKAYRKLAMDVHPDVNASEQAQEEFIAVSQAYDVLGDTEKRRRYDRTGTAGTRRAARPFHYGFHAEPCAGKCSSFSSIFSRGARYSGSRQKTVSAGRPGQMNPHTCLEND